MGQQPFIIIDLPGKFDSYLSGTSEIEGENGPTPLHVAYHEARHRPRGKGYSVELSLWHEDVENAREVLTMLREHAEICIECNQDNMNEPAIRAEVAAARKVIERVDAALAQLPTKAEMQLVQQPKKLNVKTAAEVIATLSPSQQEMLLTWYVGSFDDARMPGIRLDAEVENLHYQVVSMWRGPQS